MSFMTQVPYETLQLAEQTSVTQCYSVSASIIMLSSALLHDSELMEYAS